MEDEDTCFSSLPDARLTGCRSQSFILVPCSLIPKRTCHPAALGFAHIPRVTCDTICPGLQCCAPAWLRFHLLPKPTHWVTPPKLRSTTKAVIFSFTAPVAASVTGVLAKTVNTSARPPLLWKNEGQSGCGGQSSGA